MDRGSARRSQRAAGRADALTLATVAAVDREKPLDSVEVVTGAAGLRGSIIGAIFD